MTPQQYERVREIFIKACALPADERDKALEARCADDAVLRAEVERLLAHHAAEDDGFLRAETLNFDETAYPESSLPRTIGAYEIIEKIGEGGMGVVYRAIQLRPRREVALKRVRPALVSERALRRFDLEAKVLGRLQHPGVAQIIEAGVAETDDGPLPYVAMELVEGQTLLRALDERSPTRAQRLELLARIGDAVHHAHQKGVVHRDLKPANILIMHDGSPKILDFGISRLIDDETPGATAVTATGELIGTIGYMSPEQLAGSASSADVRSDVYALGVIGYEMLVELPPLDLSGASLPEAARVVREEEPTRLSVFDRTLRGDVETIIGTALAKEPERRYQSAEAMVADIRRHLADEPIAARPPSTIYQLMKFSRRNRTLVSATAAVVLALLVGLAGTAWQAQRATNAQKVAQRERDEATLARDEAEAVLSVLIDAVTAARPDTGSRDLTVREAMDDAADAIGNRFTDRPATEARLRYAIGSAQLELGALRESRAQLEHALRLRREHLGYDDELTIQAIDRLGTLNLRDGAFGEAEPLFREALALRNELLGTEHENTLASKNNLAHLLQEMGRFDEAEPLYQEVLEIKRRMLPPNDESVLKSVANLGYFYQATGSLEQAEPLYAEALNGRRSLLGDTHPDTINSLANYGTLVQALHGDEAAEPHYREALRLSRQTLGDDHHATLLRMNNMGFLLRRLGRADEAEALYRESLERSASSVGNEHPIAISAASGLALTLIDQGRLEEAERIAEANLARGQAVYGPGHWQTATLHHRLAQTRYYLGKFEECEPDFQESVRIHIENLGLEHRRTRGGMRAVIFVYEKWHEADPEGGHAATALELRERIGADPDTPALRIPLTIN